MPDEPSPDMPAGDERPGADQPKGYMVSVAVILIGILVVLVVFMNLSGQGATASTAITQNTWSLQSFSSQDGTTTPVLNGTAINATFTLDGKITGNGGCNWYSGRYMIQETRMVVSRITTTSMACWNNTTMIQEKRYYLSLEETDALRIHNGVLTLYDIGGKPVLTFVPARAGN